jgi:hypothetical protein
MIWMVRYHGGGIILEDFMPKTEFSVWLSVGGLEIY